MALVEREPQRRCMTFLDASGEHHWASRESFYFDCRDAAAVLQGHGVGAGDHVIIVLPSGEPAARAVVGSLLLGAVPALIAPPMIFGVNSNLRDVVRATIRRTGAKLALCDERMATDLDLETGLDGTVFLYGAAGIDGGDGSGIHPVLPQPDDVAALQLTSGTTGFSKICVWKQSAVLAALEGEASAIELNSDDVFFNWTPLYHDLGLVNSFLLGLVTGTPTALLGPLDFVHQPARWLRGISDTRATTTWSPNFGYAITTQRVRDDQIEGSRSEQHAWLLERRRTRPLGNNAGLRGSLPKLRAAPERVEDQLWLRRKRRRRDIQQSGRRLRERTAGPRGTARTTPCDTSPRRRTRRRDDHDRRGRQATC